MIIIDLRKYKTVFKTNQDFKLEEELNKLLAQVRGATQVIYDQPDYIVVYKDQHKYLKNRVSLPVKTQFAISPDE